MQCWRWSPCPPELPSLFNSSSLFAATILPIPAPLESLAHSTHTNSYNFSLSLSLSLIISLVDLHSLLPLLLPLAIISPPRFSQTRKWSRFSTAHARRKINFQ